MNCPKCGEEIDMINSQYKPISPWGYIGYMLLFSLPIAGFIIIIVKALDSKGNINVRNFARCYLWVMLITVVVTILTFVIIGIVGAIIGAGAASMMTTPAYY